MAATWLRGVEQLAPGDHALLVYDSEERRVAALQAFFRRGFGAGERVLYLAERPDDPLGLELERHGVDGAVVVAADDAYLTNGSFDPDQALDGFRGAIAESLARGYPALRTGGGPPAQALGDGFLRALTAYEQTAAGLFADGTLVSLCAYDAREVPAAALLALVDAHPVVVYAVGGDGKLRVETPSAATLAPVGWLDVTTVGALATPLARAAASGTDVIVDLARADFVDVAALSLLAEAARALHVRGRQLIVAAAPEPVPGVLAILGFDRLDGLVLR